MECGPDPRPALGDPGIRAGDRGASAVEYAIMAALIAVVIIVGVALLGGNVKALFDTAATSF